MRHHVIVKSLFLLWAVTAGSAVLAQTLENEFTPYLGYRMGGSFEATDNLGRFNIADADSYGFIVNVMTRNQALYEFIYSKQETSARYDRPGQDNPDIGLELESYELGGVYEFDGQMVRPYVSATVGATRASVRSAETESDTFLSGSLGLGIKIRPDDRVGVRFEVRLRGILVSSSSRLFCSTGTGGSGCSVTLAGNAVGQVETFGGVVIRF